MSAFKNTCVNCGREIFTAESISARLGCVCRQNTKWRRKNGIKNEYGYIMRQKNRRNNRRFLDLTHEDIVNGNYDNLTVSDLKAILAVVKAENVSDDSHVYFNGNIVSVQL